MSLKSILSKVENATKAWQNNKINANQLRPNIKYSTEFIEKKFTFVPVSTTRVCTYNNAMKRCLLKQINSLL